MIVLDRVTATTGLRAKKRTVLSSVSLTVPSDRRIALFGSSSEDKKVVIDLFGGVTLPRAGFVIRRAKVSFPVGHLGSFIPKLSVKKNVEHLIRLYGGDRETVVDFVERVSGLGPSFGKPYADLSIQERKLLGRIVAYSIPFDLYVLTDEIAPGHRRDADVSYGLFQARARTAGMIIPTRHPQFAREHCEMALILEGGQLLLFDDVERALVALKRIAPSKELTP